MKVRWPNIHTSTTKVVTVELPDWLHITVSQYSNRPEADFRFPDSKADEFADLLEAIEARVYSERKQA